MPKRKRVGVPGRCSLPPGYEHFRPEGFVPWAKPYMNAMPYDPMMAQQMQLAQFQQQNKEEDQDDEEEESDCDMSTSGSSSRKAKSSKVTL